MTQQDFSLTEIKNIYSYAVEFFGVQFLQPAKKDVTSHRIEIPKRIFYKAVKHLNYKAEYLATFMGVARRRMKIILSKNEELVNRDFEIYEIWLKFYTFIEIKRSK